ncbi:MAG: hypothetical protein AAF699_22645, partial [Pseudomonadota bacterium]
CTTDRGRLFGIGLLASSTIIFVSLKSHYILIWMLGAVAFAVKVHEMRARLACSVISTLLMIAGIGLNLLGSAGAMQIDLIVEHGREIGLAIFSIGLTLAIPVLTTSNPPSSGVIGRAYAAGTFLATFSYSAYLVHMPLLYLYLAIAGHEPEKVLGARQILSFTILVVVLLFSSWVFYFFTERHTQSVRRFAYSLFRNG